MSGPETSETLLTPAASRAAARRPRSRWLALAERFGMRVSWVMSGIMLTAIYFVLLAPFKLLAGRWESGWERSRPVDLDTQF